MARTGSMAWRWTTRQEAEALGQEEKAELKLLCSHCGKHVAASTIHEVCEREVQDLPCFEYTTTVVVETYR